MRSALWLALLAPFISSTAFGWGCEGHQVVALIARAHLMPQVSAAVDSLLKAGPIDAALNRFCKDRPADPMADAATWADDIKSTEKTGNWHFVDIPRSITKPTALDPWCPELGPPVDGKNRPGCITRAIAYELGVLKDKSQTAAARAAALRYVIHFLGDIHMPLHDDDNDDQGGNCTVIQFFAEDKPANLHAIWDYKMIQRKLEGDSTTQPDYAMQLSSRYASKFQTVSAAKPNDPEAWAWETHALAEAVTYGKLSPAIPVESPGSPVACQAEKDKVQALHIVVGDAYFSAAMPVINEQLATAGYRLAVLLNDTLR